MKSAILAVGLSLAGALAARGATLTDQYRNAYAASIRDRQPLVVFVGQPARDVAGARTITVPEFPEAAGPCVVVGIVRDGEMSRKDLDGSPSTPEIQAAATPATPVISATWAEALDEVNATRAARGLRPFVRDHHLTLAAASCAEFRAARLIEGHTANDFAAVPAGGYATSSGCAAWEPGMGWGSCCTYEGYTYAGAAYSMGRDGRRYMHLFVR
jgi:hypothetical protein